jgi:NAD(P)-dependent dehydrogenase (short-subunit alcohol dehydrogenase family)
LNQKTVIITGAAGGLGSELAYRAAIDGWRIVMLDSDVRGLERAYDRIEQDASGLAVLHPMDLATAGTEDAEELMDSALREFGRLDGLVHCAARFDGLTPPDLISPEEWLLTLQINLNAAWLLSAAAMPALKEAGNGKLVFLLDNLEMMKGALWGPYGVSKHALRALAEQFANSCKSSTVEVVAFHPGPMKSPLRSRAYHSENPESLPDPSRAAEWIMDFLAGRRHWTGPFVDLAREGG